MENGNIGMKPCNSLPFPLNKLLNIVVSLIWPCQAALSGLVSLVLTTTAEKNDPLTLSFRLLALGPLYAVLFLLTLPFAVFCIGVRCLLCMMRKPYEYSICHKPYITLQDDAQAQLLTSEGLKNYQFGVASANVCLLPEFLARINNLSNAGKRARSVGERIVVDQFFYGGDLKLDFGISGSRKHDKGCNGSQKCFVAGLSSHFPRLDFLCLQEVFDWNYNKSIRKELHKVFPYIVHDVGIASMRSNYYLLNSGLLFASLHPVLHTDFRFFPHSVSQCVFSSKGLLMVKVQIGKETDSGRQVGYIFTTHLQAYQGKKLITVKQMDDIMRWEEEFRQQTHDAKDIVLFNILCGDLNIDNMSPGDQISRDHKLFDVYVDPCRAKSGQDHSWTIGTEFKQIFIHEPRAATPEALKSALSDPVLRHRYLVDADINEQSMDSLVHVKLRTDHQGNISSFPEAGKRRIDYIMYRRDQPLDICRFQFITRLASLTDHIPVAMVFKTKS